MKRILTSSVLLLLVFCAASGQTRPQVQFPDYKFTTVKANPITSVKNQASSGTCWCFSALGFVESEIIRINNIKDESKYPDLSEFFVVSHSYCDRAEKYVRLDGHMGFSAGSSCEDAIDVIRDYGIVPNSEMTGMNYGTPLPKQAELDAVLKAYVDAIVRNPNRILSTAWKRGFNAIVSEYLGKWPESFKVDGKEYTPQSYRDALKFNPDDYISNILISTFQLFTMFYLLAPGCCCMPTAYYVICILLFLYFPLGKLRHLVYYFSARYHLGFFYGWRNVWPKNED